MKNTLLILGIMATSSVLYAQQPVMTNQTIQAMIAGGVPVPVIVRSIRTATKINLHYTDPADRTRFIEAGATATDTDAIIKAIAYREYAGRDVSPEPEPTFVAAVPKPLPTQVAVLAPAASAPSPSSAPAAVESSRVRSFTKSASAKQRIKTSIDDFVVWVDETKWKQAKSDTPGQLQFTNVNGTAWARVISERVAVPTDTLREIAVANAQKAAPDTKIILDEKRIVNGREILALQMRGTMRNIPFTYFGYYHGGTSGMIQVITYTVAGEFDRNLKGFTDFLNGLELSDRDMPVVSTQEELVLNPKISIRYDQKKWKRKQPGETGRFSFAHSSGDGYALVIFERWPTPTDSLPDIALKRFRNTDPDANIVFREKRRVSGVDVWFLEIEAAVNNIPVTYYGYYYGDKSGTVQVLTYTAKTLVAEYDKDFMNFLNGFVVSE